MADMTGAVVSFTVIVLVTETVLSLVFKPKMPALSEAVQVILRSPSTEVSMEGGCTEGTTTPS
jgi:hypothetical protein